MTKKDSVLIAAGALIVGVVIGFLAAPRNGKVVINGNNNKVRTGYKSNCSLQGK